MSLHPLFNEIFGQEEAITALKDLVEEIKLKTLYSIYNQKPVTGVILAGPKGVGKTTAVNALINELEINQVPSHCFYLSYKDIANSFIDKPVENLRSAFDYIDKLSEDCHVIMFIDEIDGMFPEPNAHTHESDQKRSLVFLEWMDGGLKSTSNVTVIGATNRIDRVYNPLLRPGRFAKVINFKYLEAQHVLDAVLSHISVNISTARLPDASNELLEAMSKGYNGADAKFIADAIIKFFILKHLRAAEDQAINLSDIEQLKTVQPPIEITVELICEICKNIQPSEQRARKVKVGF